MVNIAVQQLAPNLVIGQPPNSPEQAALGMAGSAFIDLVSLMNEVSALRAQVSNLVAGTTVGNPVYGGPIQTTLAPNVYTVGPFRMDCDGSFANNFDLWVPDNIKKLVRCRIRVKLRPIRSSVNVAASGGGQTSGAGTSHTHAISGITSQDSSGGTSGGPSGTVLVGAQNHTHGVVALGQPTSVENSDTTVPTGTHTHGISHNHSFGTLSNANEASHTHSVAAHTHPLTLTCQEGGSPAGVRLLIDAVDRSTALGGPWNADFGPLDITAYLLDSLGRPVTGAHPISLSTTQAGAIEASLDFYVIAQPVPA